jgi:hypothetical protein
LTVERPSRAVITNDVELLRGHYQCAGEESFLLQLMSEPDDVRMQGAAPGSGELFLGIAPAGAVAAYLDGVAHDTITEWDCDVDDIVDVEYTTLAGTAAPTAPAAEPMWVTAASGTEQPTLDWTIESGAWTVVVMNADASAGVAADLRFGAQAPSGYVAISWISFAGGLVALIGGGLLLYFGLRRKGRDLPPPPQEARTEPPRGPVAPRADG